MWWPQRGLELWTQLNRGGCHGTGSKRPPEAWWCWTQFKCFISHRCLHSAFVWLAMRGLPKKTVVQMLRRCPVPSWALVGAVRVLPGALSTCPGSEAGRGGWQLQYLLITCQMRLLKLLYFRWGKINCSWACLVKEKYNSRTWWMSNFPPLSHCGSQKWVDWLVTFRHFILFICFY